jgi:hypothetical protein
MRAVAEDIWAILHEVAKGQKENKEQLNRTDEQNCEFIACPKRNRTNY